MPITYNPIGVVHSPHKTTEKMPIQPSGALGIKGRIEIFPEYAEGLKDLDGFSHIFLIYHFHRVTNKALTVIPFLDTTPRGVLSTRAPVRPNPIGLSVVRLINIDNSTLYVENIDILDQTPLLDIKPYIPDFDHFDADRIGWFQASSNHAARKKSDDRFK